jgi:hypothetical protein
VGAPDLGGAVEVGDRARDAQHAVVDACALSPAANQPQQPAAASNFVRSAAVTVLGIDDADVPALDQLMRK